MQPVLRVGQPDRLEQFERPRARLPPRQVPMCLERFGDLAFERQQRVERRAGILEDETDPAAVHAAQRRGVAPTSSTSLLAPASTLEPVTTAPGRVEQSGRGEHGHRLTRAGLTDDAEGLFALHVERHAAHDLASADAHAADRATCKHGSGHASPPRLDHGALLGVQHIAQPVTRAG